MNDIIEKIEKMTILEINELVKAMEEKFGVSANMMMSSGPAADAGEAKAEEKTSFGIELKAAGDAKIQVIKAIKEITGLGLKESQDIVNAAPKIVKEGLSKADAEEMKKKLEAVGAVVELK